VGCIHIGQFRREFDKGHEYEAVSVGYDYELIFSLGTFLGIKTSDEILEIIDVVEQYGLDAMSVGVVLGWATEALDKGLVSNEGYMDAIKNIAWRKNEFYILLGQGADKASDIYGGKEFSMTFAKNEMSGYHTGYGTILGSVVGARHSHLCNGGYSLDQSMKELDKEKLVEDIFKEEKERCMLNSLVICLFARKVYDRETIISALNSIGREITNEELTELGEKIYTTKLRIKKMLGFDQSAVKLPKRLFETPSLYGALDEDTAYELINMYVERTKSLA
jgi:aldehyde:ferredoxin oxidoreductase